MDFFQAVERRRSIRRFTGEAIEEGAVRRALEAAVWAPNSSNVQTWDFYWVRSVEKKRKLVEACLGQSAARSASELVVITANPTKWRRSHPFLIKWVEDEKAPAIVKTYYSTLVPMVYRWGFMNCLAWIKWAGISITGFFRPVVRRQAFRRDMQEVAIKSAALAAENLVLGLAAQNLDSCMMEGFDENRVRRTLGLTFQDRVVMVVGIGRARAPGTWGRPFRIPQHLVLHEV